ncbi:hypothetical protein BDV18DRAFT_161305 [Aspergillus unguis]
MRGDATSSSTFEDELRLFPGGKQQDPDGVRVVPGQTFGKKANIPSGFKPWDTLSRGAKSSGPVRASGRPRSFFSSQSRSTHTDSPERSSKRRRVESPEETPKRIYISDDDAQGRSSIRESPTATRSDANSPFLSQHSETKRRKNHTNGRGSDCSTGKNTSSLDRLSSEDQDISFTRDAAKERRRESNGEVPRELLAQPSNLSVEIVKKPSIFNGASKSSGKGRPSYSRESPDELQGEVTVGPVPTSLGSQPDKTSSSDIRPTVFIPQQKSKRGKGKKGKGGKKGRPASQIFALSYYRGGSFLREALGGGNDHLTVDPRRGESGEIIISIADSGFIHSISLHTVRKVVVGESSSRKIRFELSKVEGEDTKLDFELSSADDKERLCALLRDLTIDVQEKEGNYIDNAFKKGVRDHVNVAQPNGSKRPLALVEIPEESSKQSQAPTKRKKLSDALQNKEEDTSAQPDLASAHGRHVSPSLPATTTGTKHASSPSSTSQRSIGVEIPVKKFSTLLQAPTRATRSMSQQAPMNLVDDDDEDREEEHTPQPDLAVDQKWNRKPLVYPRFGKKKAEVNALDLERLAPHEFLNDNIIGFYIRFLEDHLQRCNAEVAKRVYFFNSYFFATLTNSPRGRRNINYEGVEKWTRNVDLFSYDYIIVPINENAHWYISIIANLPHLEGIIEESKASTSQSLSEVQEVQETPEPETKDTSDKAQPKEETARKSLASMRLTDQETQPEGSKSGDDEWPELEENPGAGRAKLSDSSNQPQPDSQKDSETAGTPKKSRKSKKKQSLGMRYDISQPIIITFDSLNQSRSSTISTLREYLSAEAKSKRGIEINKALVKGMTAKEIPQQPNFSDCGLYLLAYIEKFVQNPDLFVRKLLRKEMRSREDWPPLRSGLLRSRLHKFMEQLYSEQEQLTESKADEETLMVDQQPISYLLGTSVPEEAKKDGVQKTPERQIQVERSPPPQKESKSITPAQSREPSPSAQPSPRPEVEPETDEQDAGPATLETQESVICIEPPASQPESPKVKGRDRPYKSVVVEVPDSQEVAKVPAQDVAQETQSQYLESQKQHGNAVYVGDSDGAEDAPRQRGSGFEVQVQVSGTPPKST